MRSQILSAALMAAGLLVAAPAFAQTTPATKQPTQEGGGAFIQRPCSLPAEANAAADPDCNNPYKQRTQNLSPSAGTDTATKK